MSGTVFFAIEGGLHPYVWKGACHPVSVPDSPSISGVWGIYDPPLYSPN